MYPLKTAEQVMHIPMKFIKNFARIAKPFTLLTHQNAKFKWTPADCTVFMTLKEAIIQATILHYSDLAKKYTVYTDASENACEAQLS